MYTEGCRFAATESERFRVGVGEEERGGCCTTLREDVDEEGVGVLRSLS